MQLPLTMSGNTEDDKLEAGKSFPLDLVSKLGSVRTIEGKSSLVSGQQLRNMRLLTHTVSGGGQPAMGTPTIITTNLVSQVLKQGNFNT